MDIALGIGRVPARWRRGRGPYVDRCRRGGRHSPPRQALCVRLWPVIGLLGGVAAALTCADVFAAQKSRIARIGFLSYAVPPSPMAPECYATPECKSFRRDAYQNLGCWLPYDLNVLGWREGDNLLIESRWGYGDPAKLPTLAA
jgi:hypothetical protein